MEKVRIDKWLWAARFFKTRSLAKQAIDGGKVQCDGQKIKPSKDIVVGQTITLKQGWDEKVVEVLVLSDQRRGAPEAQRLYAETQASIAKRETEAEQRRILRGPGGRSDHKPNKKERRQIHRFQNIRDLD